MRERKGYIDVRDIETELDALENLLEEECRVFSEVRCGDLLADKLILEKAQLFNDISVVRGLGVDT